MVRLIIKSKNRIVEILVWGLIGLVLSMSIAAMVISGSHSIESFYDVGRINEVRHDAYRTEIIQEYGHQEASGKVVLDNGMFYYRLGMDGKARAWKYYCIKVSDVSTDEIAAHMSFYYYKNGELVSHLRKVENLSEGQNVFEATGEPFQIMEITFVGENNSSFVVDDMRFTDSKPVFSIAKFGGLTILSFLIYSLIIVVFRKLWSKKNIKINFYVWIDILQEIYLKFAEQFVKIKQVFPFLNKYKSLIRTGLFLILFLYNVWIDMQGNYADRFKYHMVVYLFLIFMIAIMSIESKVKKVNWNNPLVWSWLALGVMYSLSDYIIPKDFRFSGYAIILGIGFFIFIWNNMKDPSEILHDFKNAIVLFLVVITAFCIVCRPEIAGARYAGFCKNPSVFALYLSVCWIVLLCALEEKIKAKSTLIKILPCLLGLCAVFVFAWKSQSACPLLVMACISFMWFVRNAHYVKQNNSKKYLAYIIAVAIVMLIPTYVVIDWGINHIPQKLNTVVQLEGDAPVAKETYGLVVHASEGEEQDNRLVQKFSSGSVSNILSGRDYYYRTYLRKMNLFGHQRYPVMWGKRRLPHNALIGVAYQYGVFTSVPYILMLIFVIVKTFRYSWSRIRYASMPFDISFSVILMSMADNIERPFNWLPWFALYLLMGCVFVEKQENETEEE